MTTRLSSDGQPYSDLGTMLAQACLGAVQSAIAAAGLAPLEQVEIIHGTGIPLQDPAETDEQGNGGVLWARVGNVWPTDGSGNPFTESRPSFEWPAWVHAVEVGIICCRSNIDSAGYAPDPDYETAVAVRDGNYRMALLDAMRGYLPERIKPCALGMVLDPWSPIGPDGGISGGLVVVRVVTDGNAVAPGGPCGQ